jgi:CheY-like chemotaxis protein
LEAALLNLAVNARDAMPDGGDLTIAAENQVVSDGAAIAAGDYVVITVSDTGIGMPPDVLQRVFEPFFTTKESGKGTGLGLSMVYGFVQQCQGHVAIDSAPNVGTTIRIFLPRAEQTVERPIELQATEMSPFGAGRTVLVVEDDPAVRQVAVSTLHSLGFEVMEAASGDEAARLLKANGQVHLVFSDLRMPGELSGIDLARFIKREMPAIRVLLTTGYVDNDGTIGDIDLLYKPYRTAELAERIKALIEPPRPSETDALPLLAGAFAEE